MTVYKIRVKITGRKPILQNNPISQLMWEEWKSKHGGTVPPPEVEAEWRAYKDEDGSLYIPESWIWGALKEAAKLRKVKGKRGRSAYTFVMRSCEVEPEKIPILRNGEKVKDYQIDTRYVRVQRSGTIRARPRIETPWEAEFTILYNITIGGMTLEAIKEIITLAGSIGIGDFRPKFGTFNVEILGVEEV